MRLPFVILATAAWTAVARAQAVSRPDTLAPVVKAQLPMLTQKGLWAMGGVHVGTPAVLSISAGAAYGVGPRYPGSFFADVEPGLTAIRYGAGFLLYDDQVTGVGTAVRIARLHAWRQAFGVKRGPWYTGVEYTAMILLANVRIGGYVARSGAGDALGLATVDLGLGF